MTKRRWWLAIALLGMAVAARAGARVASESGLWLAGAAALLGTLAALALWWPGPERRASPETAVAPPGARQGESPRTRLGQLLVQRFSLLTETHLEQALAAQRGTPKRLGQVLVERGLISEDDLRAALDYQAHEHDGWLGLSRGAREGAAHALPRRPR